MSLWGRIKEVFTGKKEPTKPEKEKYVKKSPQDRTTVRKEKKKKEGFFSSLKNLFKAKKEKNKTEEVKTEEVKKPVIKKEVKKNSNDTDNSIYNNAKKAPYELISDMSVRVKLETSKGIEYRHWAIFGKEKIVSNYEVYDTIDNDIFENNNLNFIFTTSGQNFEIFNYSIVASYRNFDER